jgi:hypothetical protein
MRVELSNQWQRARAAAWHGLRCDRCRKPAQRVLVCDNAPMREVLLRQIEACQQNSRPVVG